MAVTIRLSRRGVNKNPFYRIVASEKGTKRDGKYIEILGHFDPMQEPNKIVLKEDRVRRWIETGAQYTTTARALIKRTIPGLIEKREEHQLKRIQAARKARKARMSGAAKSKSAKAKK